MKEWVDFYTFNEDDRNKISILHDELVADIERFNKKFPVKSNDEFHFFISTIPRTLQRRGGKRACKQNEKIAKYKSYLREQFEPMKENLMKFKEIEELLLYIIAYLDKKHYREYDADNLPKHFCDALKYFVGDDSKIQTLIVEKKQIKSKKSIKSDYLEQFFVCVADKQYKKESLNNLLFFNPFLSSTTKCRI